MESVALSSIIRVDEDQQVIYVVDAEFRNIDKREKMFAFDGVLGENSSN